MENKQVENAINFLLFSYFGITLDDNENDDIVLNAAINRAYRDASSHVLSIENEEVKNERKKYAIELIIKKIEKIKGINTKDNFNAWHEELICGSKEKGSEENDGLMKIYGNCTYKKDKNNNERKFTYGIAQKWVNMTMKYLYILNSIFITFKGKDNYFTENYGKYINDISKYLHVPLDRYIFKAAKDDYDITNNLGAWSKIEDYDNYKKHQYNIAKRLNNISPIDWEGTAWIEAAKKNNG